MFLFYIFYICSLSHSTFQSALLDQWTQFLIAEALIPANQISTDDFAGSLANQTNLAIKGIVGIKAMSVIAGLLGDTVKEANYSVRCPSRLNAEGFIYNQHQSIVSSYVIQWQEFATSSDGTHLTLSVSISVQFFRLANFRLSMATMQGKTNSPLRQLVC